MLCRRSFLALSALVASGLMGCASSRNSDERQVSTGQPEQEGTASDATVSDDGPDQAAVTGAVPVPKALVVFFSRAGENYANGGTEVIEVGHTKVMAGHIAEALGADTYEIVPTVAYPDAYEACCDTASAELAADARPTIAGALPDLSSYEVVFIGCPIWWGCEPMVVRTFLDGVNLSGKTIVPFTTHGGSGLGSVPSSLQSRVQGATFLEGKAVAGTDVDDARDEIVTWAQGLFN